MGLDCSHGLDNLPSIIFSKFCYSLARSICTLFNVIYSRHFSHLWKSIFVIFIKFGNRNTVRNYRPIYKLNSLPKFLEKLIELKLSHMFNNVIINNQHCIRTYKLTCINLLVYVTDFFDTIEKRDQVDVIYIYIYTN